VENSIFEVLCSVAESLGNFVCGRNGVPWSRGSKYKLRTGGNTKGLEIEKLMEM